MTHDTNHSVDHAGHDDTHDSNYDHDSDHNHGNKSKGADTCCSSDHPVADSGTAQELAEMRAFALQPDGTYKIDGDMIIGDIVAAFPQAVPIMLGFGLHCVGCHASAFDTVEAGSRGHGMGDEEIMLMITEMNAAINYKIDNVEMTPRAIAKVKELRTLEAGKEAWPLRIAVMAGGCAGFNYEMDFDNSSRKHDLCLEFDGLVVVIDPESLPLIKGSKIDYVDSLQGSGFKIENPNANRKCGCGKSFS